MMNIRRTKCFSKALALLLAAGMVVTSVPVSELQVAAAEAELEEIADVSENAVVPENETAGAEKTEATEVAGILEMDTTALDATIMALGEITGKCGDNAYYTLTGSEKSGYTVEISGSGRMYDGQIFTNAKIVTIGDEITYIGANNFKTSTLLEQLTIGKSVKEIGDHAFSDARALRTLTLPEGLETIGEYAFCYSSSLGTVTLPEGLKVIKKQAFVACNLKKVVLPKSITRIEEYAFNGNEQLTEVVFQSGVEFIGTCAFYSTQVKNVTVPGTIGFLGQTAFGNALTAFSSQGVVEVGVAAMNASEISDLSGILVEGVTKIIGPRAFERCANVTKLVIPNSVTTVGEDAFAECTGLKEITIGSGVKTLAQGMFSKAEPTTLVLSEGLERLDSYFSYKTDSAKIQNLTIPSTVKYISGNASSAFQGTTISCVNKMWYNLETGKTIDITTTSLSDVAYGTTGAAYVLASESNKCGENLTWKVEGSVLTITGYGAMYDYGNGAPWREQYGDAITSVVFVNQGSGITHIGDYAFSWLYNLGSITLPDSVESIGKRALHQNRKLTSIVIPANVKYIGEYAIASEDVLKSIEIRAKGVEIDDDAFFSNKIVESLTFTNGGYAKTIGEGAFKYLGQNADGFSVVLPAGVEYIGKNAFAESSITSFDASACENYEVASWIFSGTNKLQTIDLGGVRVIESYMFGSNTKNDEPIQELVIPATVQYIGDRAFVGCQSLKKITINCPAEKLSSYTFNGCNSVEEVYFSDNTREIPASLCGGFANLKELTLPANLQTIGSGAFYNCSGLDRLVIPDSVTRIGYAALAGIPQSALIDGGSDWYDINGKSYKIGGTTNEVWRNGTGTTVVPGEDPGFSYTIVYNANGGSGSVAKANAEGGIATVLSDGTGLTKTGFTFAGWNTKADGTGDSYAGGSVFKYSPEKAGTSLTLYAQWVGRQNTVSFDADGGVGEALPITVNYKGTYGELPIVSKEGFIFAGWSLNGEVITKDTICMVEEDHTLTALWKQVYQVVTPTCDVAEGVLETGTKIYLSCDTNGAEIYYTTDGATPSKESTPYRDAITATESMTLKAIAVKDGYTDSAVMVRNIQVISKSWGNVEEADLAYHYRKDAEKLANLSADLIPNTLWIGEIAEYTYDGASKKPADFAVYYGNKLLVAGTDYTIAYSDNIKAGEAKVTVKGKGNYAATTSETFEIQKANLEKAYAEPIVLAVKSGNEQKFVPKVLYALNGKMVTLKAGVDYEFAEGSDKEGSVVDTYHVELVGIGNYEGNLLVDASIQESVTPRAALSKVLKIGKIADQIYKGYEIEPEWRELITMGGELSEGEDYVVTYANNVNAGTAQIIFTGIKYSGSVIVKFKIKPYKLTDAATESEERIMVEYDTMQFYEAEGVVPELYLYDTYGEYLMKQGVDYTVKVANNKAIGNSSSKKVPAITITGKGNYTGSISKKFAIEAAYLEDAVAVANDVVYTGKPGIKASTLVYSRKGTKLAAGKDYVKDVKYTYDEDVMIKTKSGKNLVSAMKFKGDAVDLKNDVLPLGAVVRATVEGYGNYQPETYATTTFRCIAKEASIAKATLKNKKIADQSYTGKAITLTKADLGVIELKVGKEVKTLDVSEYEIVGYEKNVNKGTAKVTIKGLGNYGGTKTFTFKIVPAK